MKRQFIISSILALGMGIAQAQTQPMQPAPMQGGSNDPRQVQQQQQPSAPMSAGQGMGAEGVSQAAAQSFKGCLNGSAGSWTLTSDKGKSMNLSGTDSQLSPYQGQEVRIQGVQSANGPITVSSIDKVSDTCANQAASNTGSQTSSTSQNDMNAQSSTSNTSTTSQSATATTPSSSDNMSQSAQAPAASTTPDNSSAASSQNSTATSSATTPPVTNQTPANTVGSGETGQSSAQSTTSSTGDQNANQGVRQYSDMDQNAGNDAGSKLPQTASPLPLLGLLGLGSLVTGIVSRRKK